jgi:hypothetical protein
MIAGSLPQSPAALRGGRVFPTHAISTAPVDAVDHWKKVLSIREKE